MPYRIKAFKMFFVFILTAFLFVQTFGNIVLAYTNIIDQNFPSEYFVIFYNNPPTANETKDVAVRWYSTTAQEVCSVSSQIYSENSIPNTEQLIVDVYESSSSLDFPLDGLYLGHSYNYFDVPVSNSYAGFGWSENEESFALASESFAQGCLSVQAGYYYYFIFNVNFSYPGVFNDHVWNIGVSDLPKENFKSYKEVEANNLVSGTWIVSNVNYSIRINNDGTGGQEPEEQANFPLPDEENYDFTDQDFGLIGNYIRDLFRFLFVPKSTVLEKARQNITSIDDRVPFSYFYQGVELFQESLSVSHSARFEMSMVIPLNIFGKTGTVSFAPLSSESIGYYAGDWLDSVRTLMIYILWVSWAWMWYHVAKNKFK